MKERLSVKRIAFLGITIALALVMYIIENLIPSFWVPGAKLGLSNIFTLIVIIILGLPEALVLVIVRTALGCLITGNVSALPYSMISGVVACIIGWILFTFLVPKISIIACSVCMAIVHNIIQTLIFCLITMSLETINILPYLVLLGVLSGLIVGIVSYLLINKVPISVFEWLYKNKKKSKI